jgi:hypothetical protein
MGRSGVGALIRRPIRGQTPYGFRIDENDFQSQEKKEKSLFPGKGIQQSETMLWIHHVKPQQQHAAKCILFPAYGFRAGKKAEPGNEND